jgi:hypothetical protein
MDDNYFDILDDPPKEPPKVPARRTQSAIITKRRESGEGQKTKLSDIGMTLRKNFAKIKVSCAYMGTRTCSSHTGGCGVVSGRGK